MTEQLYYESAYTKEFSAKVLSCVKAENGFWVVLDRTAFFPEQGGQYADGGELTVVSGEHASSESAVSTPAQNEPPAGSENPPEKEYRAGEGQPVLQVRDVQQKGGEICHLVDEPLAVGTAVMGRLDWADRYDKMQQHTGEHIVSGIVHRRFHYNNVGFRLGPEHVTMDYSGEMSMEQLHEVEREANEAVWKNLPVKVMYPTEEELEDITYRSKIEIEGQIRIVEIPGYDVCACCAPHVERTGEIGIIKIVNVQRYKGGVRVYMLCGARALEDYHMRLVTLRETSNLLSVKDEMSFEAAKRLKDEAVDLRVKLGRVKNELVTRVIEDAAKEECPGVCGKGFILFEEGMEKRDMQRAADRMADLKPGFCGIFNGSDKTGYLFTLASRNLDCRSLAAALREKLGAKGGGSAQMIQGSLAAGKKEITALLESEQEEA